MPLVDAHVDYVGVYVRDGSRAVPGSRRADIGVYAIYAPRQLLAGAVAAGDLRRLVWLDVGHPRVVAHLLESLGGDAGSVALQRILVGVEYLGTVALGVLSGNGCRVFDLPLIEDDNVLARDDAFRRTLASPGIVARLSQRYPGARQHHRYGHREQDYRPSPSHCSPPSFSRVRRSEEHTSELQ